MITTVTLNVAIDKSYIISELKKDEVMRVQDCKVTPGGKGLNVARIVKLCGEDVLATGFIGGHAGAYVKEMLDEQQIPNNFVHTASETRTCINVLDEEGNSTEFLEPGASVSDKDIEGFLKKFEQIIDESEVITISGSTPRGVETDIYAKLIQMVKQKNKKVILDTSGDLLKESITAEPSIIKPNTDEVQNLLSVSDDNWEKFVDEAKQLQGLGIETVVISLGEKGALVVSEEGLFHGKPPRISPVNTVGSGDSMVAALAVGLKRNYSIEDMLKYAISVSTANALTMTTGSFKEEDRKKLYDQINVKRL
ncbi:1-phosphofructokinase [Gracilibacillus sp. YIM 98692]|uniref:1-phosphofructokinase n=1 Tax=Gracilibacillus sp. YIM 98692 TaxID=2663532 RepID=UPI0013D756C5|nr:1-phosphofructokinase [Gracilibacillus sp. YIM 98692]